MAIIRQIAQMGQPVLRLQAAPVMNCSDAPVQSLIEDMLATAADADGAGLAAPQVFESLSLFVVTSAPSPRYPDAPSREQLIVINPEIVAVSQDVVNGWEGCLSIPGIRGLVPRHSWVSVRYMDRSGLVVEETLKDFSARVFQHEFDHLQGILFLDRVADSHDLITEKEYFRMLKERS